MPQIYDHDIRGCIWQANIQQVAPSNVTMKDLQLMRRLKQHVVLIELQIRSMIQATQVKDMLPIGMRYYSWLVQQQTPQADSSAEAVFSFHTWQPHAAACLLVDSQS